MAENKAWIEGVDNVISWYQDMCKGNEPYYSVWDGRYLKFSYAGSSVEDGMEILSTNLRMAEQAKNSTVLVLRLHQELTKGMYVSDKTPYWASLSFRSVSVENDSLAVYNLSGNAALGRIEERLKRLEGDGADKPQTTMGFITGLLENPQVGPIVTQAAIGAVTAIINKVVPGLLPGGPMASPSPALPSNGGMGIGSVQDGVHDFDWAMDTMERVDPDMEKHLIKLAEISEKNPDLFKMLISQLKSM
jgi:hypothetical protein